MSGSIHSSPTGLQRKSRRPTASSYAARRLRQPAFHSRTTRRASHQRVFARQPGQHQRVVRRRADSNQPVFEAERIHCALIADSVEWNGWSWLC